MIRQLDLTLMGMVAFFVSCLLIPPLGVLLRRFGWVDEPDARKHHVGAIPLAGGLALALSMLLVAALFGPGHFPPGLGLACLMIFVIGFLDDRYEVRARHRFGVHLAAGLVAILLDGVYLSHLGELLGPHVLHLGFVAIPFTLFAVAGIISALNMSDGADGLAGGLGVIALFWFLCTGVLMSIQTPSGTASSLLPIIVASIGALAGFLVYNLRTPWRSRAAVFLGDGGSTTIGFLLAWLAVLLASDSNGVALSPVAAIWIVAVPLTDAVSTILRRLQTGARTATPDRKHLHHLLEAAGLPPARAVFVMHLAAFVFGGIGVLSWWYRVPDYVMFGSAAVVFVIYHAAVLKFWRQRAALEPAHIESPAFESAAFEPATFEQTRDRGAIVMNAARVEPDPAAAIEIHGGSRHRGNNGSARDLVSPETLEPSESRAP